MAGFDSKYVQCPYFHRSDDNRICCEGVEERNTINLVFESTTKQKEYKQRFCYDLKNCHTCLICNMLDRKWGEV